MKKLISIVLLLVICLSCFSCMNETTTDTNTDTGSGTSSDTSKDTGSTSKPQYTPDYSKDNNSYRPTTSSGGTIINFLNERLTYPTITKYLNGKEAALSMTFDDANNPNAGVIISETFAKYGNMRGTIMATVSFMKESAGGEEQSLNAWRNVFDMGYLDLGCHGYYHQEPTTLPSDQYYTEIGAAVEYLREKFPDQKVLTYATPNAHINDAYEEYLRQYCIANRLEAGGNFAVVGEDFNMLRVKSAMISDGTNLLNIYNALETNVEAGRWAVHLFHDIIEDDASSGWNPTKRTKFEGYCKYLNENYGDRVWFGSFEEVALYASQYNYITIDYTAASRNSMTFKVDCSLEDKETYNMPVGMSVQLPRFVTSAYAVINGTDVQELEIKKENNTCKTVVKNVPIHDTEVKIYFAGNQNFRNGCVHSYEFFEFEEPNEYNYVAEVFKCKKCECTYIKSYTQSKAEDDTTDSDELIPDGTLSSDEDTPPNDEETTQ